MTKITISRNGKELGQYAPEEIKGLVVTGELVSTDLVLHASTGEWMPLASIAEFESLFSGPQADAELSAGEKPGSESDSSLTAEEEEMIERIKQWKWRKKKGGKVMITSGAIILGCAFIWGWFFAVLGLPLLVMGMITLSAAATGLPPGVTPPPGYTNHTSSYYGGGCSSCGSGGDGGGGDGGGGDGGCGGGCGGGD